MPSISHCKYILHINYTVCVYDYVYAGDLLQPGSLNIKRLSGAVAGEPVDMANVEPPVAIFSLSDGRRGRDD